MFVGETNADPIGEPLDDYTKAKLQNTHLKFIAETGRIVVNERGVRQIIWDPPQLPTLEESIRMAAEARQANDTALLPLCTEEYRHYMKAKKASGERTSDLLTDSTPPSFPACSAVPDSAGFGLPSVPGHPPSNQAHTSHHRNVTALSDRINGAFSRDIPSPNTDDFLASRFLVGRLPDGAGGVHHGVLPGRHM